MIESLSSQPAGASPNGQILTINGKGFSTVRSQNEVKVLDATCVVKYSDFYKIICEMPATTASSDAAFIGGRGLKRLFWNNTGKSFEELDGVVEPTTIENWFDP
jgi:hypothetical protein